MAEDISPELAARIKRREDRIARVREASGTLAPLRVTPTNENMRKYLRHPSNNLGFEAGSAVWPNDTFTQDRLRDGDITEEKAEPAAAPAASAKSRA